MPEKIAISALTKGDFFQAIDGMVVRARCIYEIFRKNHRANLIVRANRRRDTEDVFVVSPAGTKLWNLKLIPIAMVNRFNYIYCIGDRFGFITYFLLSRIFKYKIIFELTEIWSQVIQVKQDKRWWQHSTKLMQVLERFVVKHADYVTAVSNYIRDFYRKYREDIDLVPLFVDEDLFHKNEADKHWGESGYKRIGIIGPFNILRNKKVLDFIYDKIDKLDMRVKVVVIGKCDHRIDNNRFTYTGYLESAQEYALQLSLLDAGIMVGKQWDPGPHIPILEYMSCALPVFTTPEGALGLDYLQSGENIIISPEEELIDRVNVSIFDSGLMSNIGNNARATVEKYYSLSANEDKLMQIIEKLRGES